MAKRRAKRTVSETSFEEADGPHQSARRVTRCHYDPRDKKSLEKAVIRGDVNGVRLLLSAGFSPNYVNDENEDYMNPILMTAMANIFIQSINARECFKLLLSAGVSPNISNANGGETPLLCAVKYGDAESVKELMNAGANVDPVSSRPDIRLHMALLQKDWDTVQSLLESGAPTKYINIQGESPLILAIAAGQIEMVQQLIDAGADVNYLNDKIGSHDGQLKSPLHDAVRGCNVEIVKLLLKRGADPNRANAKRYSVLSIATRIERNIIPILHLLLDHGADMYNSGFRSGTSGDGINEFPFEGMVETNNLEGVRLFLKRGFDMNKYQAPEPAGNRHTALHVAIKIVSKSNNGYSGFSLPDTRMLSLLIGHYRSKGTLSTELQRGIERSCSPLFYAIHINYYLAVEVLLKAGANPNLEDSRGRTALDYALFDDTSLRSRNVQILIKSGAQVRDFIERLFIHARADLEDPGFYSDSSSESSGNESERTDEEESDDDWCCAKPPKPRDRRARRSLKKAMCVVKCRILYELRNSVKDPIRERIGIVTTLRDYYVACSNELDYLRTRKFEDSVTYYDVLVDKDFWRRIKSLDAFEDFQDRIHSGSSDDIHKIIKIYIIDLQRKHSDGFYDYRWWRPALKGLEHLIGFNKDSYHLILSNILNCLNSYDRCNLGKIGEAADPSDHSSDSSYSYCF